MSLVAEVDKISLLHSHKWTLADYHAMIEAGVLNSEHRVELLFGRITVHFATTKGRNVCQ